MSYAFYFFRVLVWVASIICVLGVVSVGLFVLALSKHIYPASVYKIVFSLWLGIGSLVAIVIGGLLLLGPSLIAAVIMMVAGAAGLAIACVAGFATLR